MENNQIIQWYPGHMAKANRQIREKLKLIDTVIEILDARVPVASRNPDIQQYCSHKQHLILLNKSDLADDSQTESWLKAFRNEADAVMAYTATDQRRRTELVNLIRSLNPKGKKQLKCLICGIPNVGKSTVINSLVGKKKTQIGNKPGVTKGQQWLTTPHDLMLLDTPGILWPKFEDQQVGVHLAWIGSIKDTIFEKENIAGDLLKFLVQYYPEKVEALYKIRIEDKSVPEVFEAIAESRKLLLKGGAYDYLRTSEMLLNDFKNGKTGKITIDQFNKGSN